MFSNVKEHTFHTGDASVDYVTFGSGNKNLIIIPGLSFNRVKGNGLMLAYMYRIFAKEYKVYIIDKRNDVPEAFTVLDHADDIYRLMQALSITDAHIFGVSLGGMIAMTLAADHPEVVIKLVVAVSAARVNDTIKECISSWIKMAEDNDHRSLAEDMVYKMYSEGYIRKYRLFIPLMAKMIKKTDLRRFSRIAASCLTVGVYDRLGDINCPVMVIGGMQDKITTAAGSVEIAEKIRCKIHMYEDYGHAAYEEAKDFNKRVYEFLTE